MTTRTPLLSNAADQEHYSVPVKLGNSHSGQLLLDPVTKIYPMLQIIWLGKYEKHKAITNKYSISTKNRMLIFHFKFCVKI